jgi:hypothetical protein
MSRLDYKPLRPRYGRHDNIRDTNYTHNPRQPEDQPGSATPNARFAIEVWRVVLVRALLNPE